VGPPFSFFSLSPPPPPCLSLPAAPHRRRCSPGRQPP
jgi:hypothetical protein